MKKRYPRYRPWVGRRICHQQKGKPRAEWILVEYTEAMKVGTPEYYYHFECKKSDMEAQARVRGLIKE